MERLRDLGERRIISELLAPRYAAGIENFGDDCVAVARNGAHLIVTTDPCPPPVAIRVGFSDEYYRGWLLATINLSDLAAAGADPIGLLTSLQLPADTERTDFERLLDGLDACAARHGTRVLGGNLKEANFLDVSATAVGWCDTPPMGRSGAEPGDLVLVLGPLGLFWAGVLAIERGLIDRDPEDPLLRTVLTPDPQLALGRALRRERALAAVMDCSDGLWPSLAQIAKTNGLRVVVDIDRWDYSPGVCEAAERLNVDPARLALGWGDWQLVATCRRERLERVQQLANIHETELHVIGHCESGDGVHAVAADGRTCPLLALDSERFAADSWFTTGIDGYIEQMLEAPLF